MGQCVGADAVDKVAGDGSPLGGGVGESGEEERGERVGQIRACHTPAGEVLVDCGQRMAEESADPALSGYGERRAPAYGVRVPAETCPGNAEHGHVTGFGADEPVRPGVVTGEQFTGFHRRGPVILGRRDRAVVVQSDPLHVAGGDAAVVPRHRCSGGLDTSDDHRSDSCVVDHGFERLWAGIGHPQRGEQGRGDCLERLGSS